jgi:hypothetical protein
MIQVGTDVVVEIATRFDRRKGGVGNTKSPCLGGVRNTLLFLGFGWRWLP